MLGKIIKRRRKIRNMKKKGIMPRNIVSIGMSDTPAKTYTLRPTGGVIKPISINTVK
jgi:hypothetical protein